MTEPAEQPPISNDEAEKLCKPPPVETKDFLFQQTMYRIKDPKKSLQFYTEVLGMVLLQKMDFPSMKFSLYFLGYEDATTIPGDLGTGQRTEWALSRKATIELTQYVSIETATDLWTNWGTENDDNCKYHNGNSDPRGYGHIGIMVPDVYKACARFQQLGVNFVKKPDDGKMKGLAFITDPDGYWIEIFNNKTCANL